MSTKIFKVPGLLGLELESAKQVIEKSGLQLGRVKERFSDGKPGVVLTQSPNPGLEIEANSKVDLVVSAGEKEVVLEKPLRTFPETVVKETVNKAPFETPSKLQSETTYKVSGTTSASAPAEAQVKISAEAQVQSQTESSVKSPSQVENSVKPLNEEAIFRGTTSGEITLKPPVPLKKETVEPPKPEPKLVPGVIGMSLEKAVSVLRAQMINVGNISEAISRAAAGTVIRQNPGAGSTVNPSVPMNLVVSKQAPGTQMHRSIL
ncbi:PASTA domain-containing protein [Methanosarcina sp. 2.H.T.1A.15]|uniref:PASTA domain-containing protein n=1 Tax=Methanosarcina sp. 2.H.T.1A.15 TaxID=1483596 RepID=UPI00318377B5